MLRDLRRSKRSSSSEFEELEVELWNAARFLYTNNDSSNKLCGRPPQYAPPLQVDLWPFDLESGVRFTCNVGYLCANFSLLRPLCSRLRPDVRDRQTSHAHHHL